MKVVQIAVHAVVTAAVVAGAQAAAMKPLPPKPSVGDIVKESKRPTGARSIPRTPCTWTCRLGGS
jgi:hypothetical protein